MRVCKAAGCASPVAVACVDRNRPCGKRARDERRLCNDADARSNEVLHADVLDGGGETGRRVMRRLR